MLLLGPVCRLHSCLDRNSYAEYLNEKRSPELPGQVFGLARNNYQRGWRRCRGGPPNPRLPPCGFGRASLTLRFRPPEFVPFRAAIARSASAESVISTKAKPRARPVSRSVTRLTRSTFPYGSKSVRREDSVAPKSKFPTKMFFMLLNFGLSSVRARRGGFGFGQVVAGRQKVTLSLPRQKAG